MQIYIIDIDKNKVGEFKKAFKKYPEVKILNVEFQHFMATHDVECVVSPANSFGLMDGGYDGAIIRWFGKQLSERTQKYIIDNYYGEQPIGSSFIIDAGRDNKKLIHTPTMRVPSKIIDNAVVYQCMRSTLITAKQNKIESIVIPVFGGSTGGVSNDISAKMMCLAYKQIKRPYKKINWDIVWDSDDEWIGLGLKKCKS